MKKIVLKHRKKDAYVHNTRGSDVTKTYSRKGAKGFRTLTGAWEYSDKANITPNYKPEIVKLSNE